MEFYLTGGAVRDEITRRNNSSDKDYLVLNETEESMISKGYVKVGNAFGVFLHPKTKEEYALAQGNDIVEELKRRDLTINSVAKNLATGEYIDPFGGVDDARAKVLRHTSKHFKDDPIRVLRLARFSATFPEFSIHPDTEKLCKEMAKDKNLFEAVPGERFLLEMKKVLELGDPSPFFELLRKWKILRLFFPELARLHGIEQNPDYHPEGDCWTHTLLVLRHACGLSQKFSVRFASLVHDLGKGLTPKEDLPAHIGHEKRGLKAVEDVCDRFKVDARSKTLSLKVCGLHLKVHKAFELRASTLLELLISLNALREGSLFEEALLCCEADNGGKNKNSYPQADFLRHAADALKRMPIKPLAKIYEGTKLGEIVKQERIKLLKNLKANYFP